MNPLEELPFPVFCISCKEGPFHDAIAVDEHITEYHLAEAVWVLASEHYMKPVSTESLKRRI